MNSVKAEEASVHSIELEDMEKMLKENPDIESQIFIEYMHFGGFRRANEFKIFSIPAQRVDDLSQMWELCMMTLASYCRFKKRDKWSPDEAVTHIKSISFKFLDMQCYIEHKEFIKEVMPRG
jgi:hypothetical protein